LKELILKEDSRILKEKVIDKSKSKRNIDLFRLEDAEMFEIQDILSILYQHEIVNKVDKEFFK